MARLPRFRPCRAAPAGTGHASGAGLRSRQRLHQADRERHFLRVAERDFFRAGGLQSSFEVDDVLVADLRERHLADFIEQRLAIRTLPLKLGAERSDVRAADQLAERLQDNASFARSFGPEVDAVHVAVREPESAMMRVIVVVVFALNMLHRESARDADAGDGSQGIQIRLRGVRAEIKRGEWLAIDRDVDLLAVAREAHLRREGCRNQQGKNQLH